MKDKVTVFILGGGLTQGEGGKWQTIDPDSARPPQGGRSHSAEGGGRAPIGVDFGKTADRWRVIAASLIYQNNPGNSDLILIPSGGQGQLTGILPEGLTIARVIKDELVALGVPEQVILEEDKAGNTYQQLKVLIDLIREKSLDRVLIISNRWHTLRVKAMIENAPGLEPLRNSTIEIISAEDIMLKHEPLKWQKKIADFYADPDTAKIIESEERGISQIKAGTYKYK